MSSTLNSDNLNGNITASENLSGTLISSGNLSGEISLASGGTGTNNYNDLSNKPQINNVTLSGNKTPSDLGLFSGYIEDLHYTDLIESGTVPYMIYGSQSGHWGMNTGAKLSNIADVAYYGPSQVSNGDVLAISGAGTPNYKWTKTHLGAAAYTNDYDDLTNKPTIPAAQVNSDWNSVSGVSEILNKPTLATVATSGDYTDLTNKPTIPAAQVNSDWNSESGVSQILNKPTLATVATTGAYSDLSGTPDLTIQDETYTATKTSGAWVINKIQGKKFGHLYQLMIEFKGTGTSVSAGDNAFMGTITSGTIPTLPAVNSTFYYHTPIYLSVNNVGTIQVRIFNEALNFSSSDGVVISVMFLA